MVLYDGTCGICTRIIRYLERSTGQAFRYESFQSQSGEALASYGLSEKDCSDALQAQAAGGSFVSGADAINAIFVEIPRFRVFVRCLKGPLLVIERECYRMFARSRGVISRGLGSKVCGSRDASAR